MADKVDKAKMGRASQNKGKRGERELAAIIRSYGFADARRGQQYCGSSGDADVIGIPGVHIECKRVENLRLWDSLDQSIWDAREGEIPVVAHRKSRKPWVVILQLDDFLRILGGSENDTDDDDGSEVG